MRRLLFFCVFVFAATLASGAAAGAQTEVPEYGGNPPVEVDPNEVINTGGEPGPTEAVLGDVVTRPSAGVGGLPVTGGDLVGLTVIGLGAIGAGTLLVTARRRTA